MTTLRVAAWASGAVAVIAVTIRRAAKTPVSSDRIFLADARWAPCVLSGNRLASSLPERRAWGSGDGGSGGRRRQAWGGGAGHVGSARADDVGSPGTIRGPGGEPPEGARQVPAVTTALRLLACLRSGGATPGVRAKYATRGGTSEPRPVRRRHRQKVMPLGYRLVRGRHPDGAVRAVARGGDG